MIDALLFAVEASLHAAGYGWSPATSRVMPDGVPPPDCGDWFAAVHQAGDSNDALNTLDEYLDYAVTMTRRVNVPLDRVGDQALAKRLARSGKPADLSFNARGEQVKDLLHADWGTLQLANDNLCRWHSGRTAYGFCEPARYAGGLGEVRLVGPEWFTARDEAGRDVGRPGVGLVAELRFVKCRRFQALEDFVG